jgi:hypothetical protein
VHRDRRIGERVEIEPIDASWIPVTAQIQGGRRARPQPVSLVEVSIGGARVISRSPSRVRVGTWMELDFDGDRGVVVVRRIADAADPSNTVYGVSFVMLDVTLRARIDQLIALHLGRELESSHR